jgi:PAS domain-containing protein
MVDIYGLQSRAGADPTPADGRPHQYDGRPSAGGQRSLRAHRAAQRVACFGGAISARTVRSGTPRSSLSFQHQGRTLLQFSLQDITARKRAEADLRVAATAFESQEGMIITDAQQRILRVNAACSRITGYAPEESVGQTPRLFASGRHDTAFYRDMGNHHASGRWKGEL